MSEKTPASSASRLQSAFAAAVACKVGVQLGVAARVAAGSLERVGYYSVVFQSAVYLAIFLAVRRGGRLVAAIGMAFVGYDLVLSILRNTIGWRLSVKVVTSLALIVVLALLAWFRPAGPKLATLVRGAAAGLFVGVLLSLVFVSPAARSASRTPSPETPDATVGWSIPASGRDALNRYLGLDTATELECATAGLAREFSIEELGALDEADPPPSMIARILTSVGQCAD